MLDLPEPVFNGFHAQLMSRRSTEAYAACVDEGSAKFGSRLEAFRSIRVGSRRLRTVILSHHRTRRFKRPAVDESYFK